MHQNRFPLGLGPKPRWRSLQHFPGSLVVLKGSTFKGRVKKGSGGKGKERQKGWKGEETEGVICPTQKFWRGAPYAFVCSLEEEQKQTQNQL